MLLNMLTFSFISSWDKKNALQSLRKGLFETYIRHSTGM